MSPDSALPETQEPSALSRRGLIRNAAGAGAVGLTAGALFNGAAGSAAAAEPDRTAAVGAVGEAAPAQAADEVAEPLIVHVRDPKSGELDVFHGDEHRRVLDPALAAALRNAAR